jgi:phosphoketolase
VTCVVEPGRLRSPRDELERRFVISDSACSAAFPSTAARVIISHTRPEPMLGALRRLDGGPARTRALGFLNRGGTLDVGGMLFANRCTWAHAVAAAADLLSLPHGAALDTTEVAAISGTGDPTVLGGAKHFEPIARARI